MALDVTWVLAMLLGVAAVIFAILAALARRRYVTSLVRLGLRQIEYEQGDLARATAELLMEAGARREAELLLHPKSAGSE